MWQQITHFISYLLLFLALVTLSVFYRQPFFVFACLLLVFLPFLSYSLTRFVFRRLNLSLQSIPQRGLKGSRFPLIIALNNPTFLPLLHAEIVLHVSSPFYESKDTETIVVPVLAKNKNEYRFFISYEKIACYQIRALRLLTYDYLHFFSFRRQLNLQTEVLILPSLQGEIEFHEAFYTEGFDEFDETSKTGVSSPEIDEIREYIPGDRLQKIHWKLSGKIDKLMVKDAHSGATHSFFVLMELYTDHTVSDCNFLDIALENAFAVSQELLMKGEPFFLASYSILKEDFVSFRIQDKEDIEHAFEQLFYEKPYDEPELALHFYQVSGLKKGTVIHVTHKGADYEDEKL